MDGRSVSVQRAASQRRGPDDERMSELEPLRLVLCRSIHPVGGDAPSGVSKGEERERIEPAEPNPSATAALNLGAALS